MKEKTLKDVEREMKITWESFRWLLKEKLEELDYMTRRMQTEMSALRIPPGVSKEYITKEFALLWTEVFKEESEMYGSNGMRIEKRKGSA